MNTTSAPMEAPNQASLDELRGHLLDALAHDLRSPITSIYMWIEILERKRDEATLARGLEVIARSARTQARMLDEATELAAVFVASPHVERAPLDFAAIVEDEIASIHERPDDSAQLLLVRADDDYQMVGDTARLRQLVRSIVGNARRAAIKLELHLSATPELINFSILDAGAPPSESRIPSLLEIRSARSAGEKPVRMTALQLAAAKRNAELHDGSLEPLHADADSSKAGICLRLPR